MNRSEALSILTNLKPFLVEKYQISRLGLFGSTARNEALSSSDVDVLVEVAPTIGLRFVDLAMDIEKALGSRADVVSRRAIDRDRWKTIEQDIAYA
jgi:predicted nucleotidyltransferase